MGSQAADDGHKADEGPVLVTLTSGFWLEETEVTQGQWFQLMGSKPWKGKLKIQEGNDYPATHISYRGAIEYCWKLTRQERNLGRLPDGWTYSLPSEAQWEYACRAGTTTTFASGDDESQLGAYAWYGEGLSGFPHQVGKKKSNAWGFSDMHGNLWEWCNDWYGLNLTGGTDPKGALSGDRRVVRGGSWGGSVQLCRSADRMSFSSHIRSWNLGFRVAAVVATAEDAKQEKLKASQMAAQLVSPFNKEQARLAQQKLAKSRGIGVTTKNSIGVEMVLIPPGQYLMGNDETTKELMEAFPNEGKEWFENTVQHPVSITQPFLLGKYEVTIRQFRQFVQATGYVTEAEKDEIGGGGYDSDQKATARGRRFNWRNTEFEPAATDDHPVVNVSWNDAVAFCNWLSRKEGKTEFYRFGGTNVTVSNSTGYRLPTEAQWEYACRAGTTNRYSNWFDPEDLVRIGNTWDSSISNKFTNVAGALKSKDRFVFTAPVGRFVANNFGVFDMIGNVAEWCEDQHAQNPEYDLSVVEDPLGVSILDDAGRTIRGGGWNSFAVRCRAAFQISADPGVRAVSLGFRISAALE